MTMQQESALASVVLDNIMQFVTSIAHMATSRPTRKHNKNLKVKTRKVHKFTTHRGLNSKAKTSKLKHISSWITCRCQSRHSENIIRTSHLDKIHFLTLLSPFVKWVTLFWASTNLFLNLLGDWLVLDHWFTHSLVLKFALAKVERMSNWMDQEQVKLCRWLKVDKSSWRNG